MMSANDEVSADQASTSSWRIQVKATTIASPPTNEASCRCSTIFSSAIERSTYAKRAQEATTASAQSDAIVKKGVYPYCVRFASRKKHHADAIISPIAIGGTRILVRVERRITEKSAACSASAAIQRVSKSAR